jgi:hypothetical protein
MNIPKRFFARILPLLILITTLIIGEHSVSHARFLSNGSLLTVPESISPTLIQSSNLEIPDQTEYDLNSPVDSGKEMSNPQQQRRWSRNQPPRKIGDIQYNLIVRDVVEIFKLLSAPNTKPVQWTNFIRGISCAEGSPCSISIKDFSEDRFPGERLFAGMASKKYIDSIFLYVEGFDQNKVTDIEITFKKKYNKRFMVSKIHRMLTDKKFIQLNGVKHANCDGSCRGGTRTYTINIMEKYFPSASADYRLSVTMYTPIVDGIGGPPKSYRFGPEELSVMRMQIIDVQTP